MTCYTYVNIFIVYDKFWNAHVRAQSKELPLVRWYCTSMVCTYVNICIHFTYSRPVDEKLHLRSFSLLYKIIISIQLLKLILWEKRLYINVISLYWWFPWDYGCSDLMKRFLAGGRGFPFNSEFGLKMYEYEYM